MIWLAGLAFFCALGLAALFLRNLSQLSTPRAADDSVAAAAVLIPARDEERNIGSAVAAALSSGAAEVVVLDDHSSDRTAEIVWQIAHVNARVRLVAGRSLPSDWRGKNFACPQLADATQQPTLIFLDADVQLAPGAAAGLQAFLAQSGAQLASGVPRQITATFSEQLLVSLIHFILLGFLPLARMRASAHPVYGTGCGQLFVARETAYRASGGHAAIRESLHDGLALPKNFRRHGFRTDLFDATEVATCRMYRGNREVWAGLTKNNFEGLGAPKVIGPMTLLLLLGHLAPFILFFAANSNAVRVVSALGIAFAFLPRLLAWRRFRQPLVATILHPFGISALVSLQWFGLIRHLLGRPAIWKGRAISAAARGEALFFLALSWRRPIFHHEQTRADSCIHAAGARLRPRSEIRTHRLNRHRSRHGRSDKEKHVRGEAAAEHGFRGEAGRKSRRHFSNRRSRTFSGFVRRRAL